MLLPTGRTVAPLLVLVALGACAGAAKRATIASVVPDFMEGDLELAIVPTPVDDRLTTTLASTTGFTLEASPGEQLAARRWVESQLPAGPTPIRVGTVRAAVVRAHLTRHGLRVDAAWLGREGYVLDVRIEEGALAIAIVANSAEGALWGLESLRQISWRERAGRTWVRLGTVRDRPAFVDRGGTDPRLGECLYKANFAWSKSPSLAQQRRGRWRYVPVWTPEEPLAVTNGAVRDAVDYFEEWSIRGAREFGLSFDGSPFRLDRHSGTDERFDASYAAGLLAYLGATAEGVHGFDGAARVLWLPQTHHGAHPKLASFSKELRERGGVPAGVALVVTGAGVLPERIDAADVEALRRAFGATRTPALVWDRVGSDGDFTPLAGRDPALVDVASGVFGDGTMVKRITRLDWSWNPRAYRPERSLRLAVRELAGPSAYREAFALVEALGDGRGPRDEERLRTLLAAVERAWGDRGWRKDLDRGAFREALRRAVGR